MPNKKWTTGLALALAAGVAVFLFALASGSHFEWQSHNDRTRINIQIGTGHSGWLNTVTIIVLVLAVAYLSASLNRRSAEGESPSPGFLRNLARSGKDCWIGGVCGGFGALTPLPAWLWRLAFAILFFAYGTGLLAYVALWIFLPSPPVSSSEPAPGLDSNPVNS